MNGFTSAREGLEMISSSLKCMLICVFFSIVPFVNAIAAIALMVLMVRGYMGVYKMGEDLPGCKKAFLALIMGFVFAVLNTVAKYAHWSYENEIIINVGITILNAVAFIFIVLSISKVMKEKKEAKIAYLGYVALGVYFLQMLLSISVIALHLYAANMTYDPSMDVKTLYYHIINNKYDNAADFISNLLPFISVITLILGIVFVKKSTKGFWNILKNEM